MGTLKGVGRIYQQTVFDTYFKNKFVKLYDAKTPNTAADALNDRVLPLFDEQGIAAVSRILTDRGSEYCGTPRSERFNKTIPTEVYQVALPKKDLPLDRRGTDRS